MPGCLNGIYCLYIYVDITFRAKRLIISGLMFNEKETKRKANIISKFRPWQIPYMDIDTV